MRSVIMCVFFFSSRRRHTRLQGDWSSDVCSSDLVERTIAMARVTSEDPASGLPDRELLGRYAGDLEIYSADVGELGTGARISIARRAEEAALAADPRIRNSEGASFEASQAAKAYANSLGFVGSYRASYCAVSVAPIAQNGVQSGAGHSGMQRDYWYSVA